jgi:polygalacturonase
MLLLCFWAMDRRDLLKVSPLVLAGTIGRVALGESVEPAATVTLYDVRTFGATGDGKTVDSPAINRAIAAVAAAGGGTLVFPAGLYLSFTIRLASKVDLYLSQGCTILAADSPQVGEATGYRGGVYDAAGPTQAWEQYQDYGHNHWANSLFYGEGLRDISIVGPGLIWGRGLSHGGGPKARGAGNKAFIAEQAGVGNKAIALKKCHNVTLRDFSVLKGGHFALLATGVDNLTIDNLMVDTDRDGFDIDCCRNVRVSNCTVNSPWDDAICPKSSYALGEVRPTENVTIANCFVSGYYELGSVIEGTWKKMPDPMAGWHNGRIKCGTESNGGFRNIAISNCVLEGSKGIALESSDGALIEDVAISNITLRDTIDAPLFLRLNQRNRGPAESMRPGTLKRVVISNVVSSGSAAVTASMFAGIAENVIEDAKVSNCFFGLREVGPKEAVERAVPELETKYPELGTFGATPSSSFYVRHVKGLEMSHVEVRPAEGETRPAFWLEAVQRADFFAVTAPPMTGGNFTLRNVTDVRILWSRAAKDAAIDRAENETV